jgi:hypothetical protein
LLWFGVSPSYCSLAVHEFRADQDHGSSLACSLQRHGPWRHRWCRTTPCLCSCGQHDLPPHIAWISSLSLSGSDKPAPSVLSACTCGTPVGTVGLHMAHFAAVFARPSVISVVWTLLGYVAGFLAVSAHLRPGSFWTLGLHVSRIIAGATDRRSIVEGCHH